MQNYPHKLVLRVNELYHDLEGHEEYGHSHDEIFVLEPARWKRVAKTALKDLFQKESKVILDVGSGTGFVPRTIGGYLSNKDLMVCADISQKMLDECRANMEKEKFTCRFDYKKYDGIHLPANDSSVDLVTANSVLHHIPDTEFFLKEVSRILKPGGYLIIGHESSNRFYKNKIIWTIYRILYLLYHPQSIFESLARRGLWPKKKSITAIANDQAAEKINKILFSEKFIEQPLTRAQINAIVDYYSVVGFDLNDIKKNLPGFELAHLETYNHLYWIFMEHYKNPIIRVLDKLLAVLFPKDGKTMMAVFQKATSQ